MDAKKSYMVTGGAHRVGLAISESLLSDGARVVVTWHTDKGEAEALASRFPGQVGMVYADFSRPQTMDEVFSQAVAWFGELDGIVVSASEFSPCRFGEMTEADIRRMLDVHASSPVLLSQAFFHWLKGQGREGVVVNITDTRADAGYSSRVPYLLGKASLAKETTLLAKASAPHLRVNAVAPGCILPSGDEAYFEKMRSVLPLGRTGSPRDVVGAVRYLLDAGYVTGETIHVDGGEHLL